ncbi:MAG: rhodanese-like domain-containing protein [Bacteroidetes bacterium]|nr:rhodanese-like domain-containing protein [Bacteroidota bacterium]
MRHFIFILALAPTLLFAQQKQILSAQEFKTKLNDKSAVVLDVRTADEFNEGHLDKAVNKNVHDKDFDTYTAKLDKSKTYLVYCLAGKRSHTAAVSMRKKGLTVFELEGGIESWNGAKLPVVK